MLHSRWERDLFNSTRCDTSHMCSAKVQVSERLSKWHNEYYGSVLQCCALSTLSTRVCVRYRPAFSQPRFSTAGRIPGCQWKTVQRRHVTDKKCTAPVTNDNVHVVKVPFTRCCAACNNICRASIIPGYTFE